MWPFTRCTRKTYKVWLSYTQCKFWIHQKPIKVILRVMRTSHYCYTHKSQPTWLHQLKFQVLPFLGTFPSAYEKMLPKSDIFVYYSGMKDLAWTCETHTRVWSSMEMVAGIQGAKTGLQVVISELWSHRDGTWGTLAKYTRWHFIISSILNYKCRSTSVLARHMYFWSKRLHAGFREGANLRFDSTPSLGWPNHPFVPAKITPLERCIKIWVLFNFIFVYYLVAIDTRVGDTPCTMRHRNPVCKQVLHIISVIRIALLGHRLHAWIDLHDQVEWLTMFPTPSITIPDWV